MGVPSIDFRPVLWGILTVGVLIGILVWELLSWVFSHVSIGWLS